LPPRTLRRFALHRKTRVTLSHFSRYSASLLCDETITLCLGKSVAFNTKAMRVYMAIYLGVNFLGKREACSREIGYGS
ncbi:hypothetical protein, partial [Pseudoalteromonas sp. P1-25]|uniref:hypothetical protein n=1 Tax=Pseudoalteromonas sp. P1-25 TaxID=1723758 RepID=UPI001F40F407